MSQKYELIFEGIDRVSDVLNKIDKKVDNALGGIGRSLKGIDGAALKGAASMAAVAAGAFAVTAALATATAGAALFVDKLKEAADIEISNKVATISLATDLGKPLQDIEAAYQRLADVVNRAEATTGLEQTNLSRRLFDNILKGTRGDVNKAVGLTAGASGALALATQGQDQNAVAQYAEKLFTNQFTQLKSIDVLTPFMNSIEGFLEKQGKTIQDFNKMTAVQRAELFNEYSKLSLDPKNLAYLSNSFKMKFDRMIGDIFSVDRGILGGFNKALEGRGNKKVIDAASSALTEVMDIIGKIGNILSDRGLSADTVLEAIFDGMNRTADFLQAVDDHLEKNRALYSRILKDTETIGKALYFIGDLVMKMQFGVVQLIGRALMATYQYLTELFNAIMAVPDAIKRMIDFVKQKTAGIANVVAGPIQNSNLNSPVGSAVGFGLNSLIPGLGNIFSAIKGNAYAGQIPNAILDLSRTEAAYHPGQKQVIASANEYILTVEQMKNLISGVAASASQTFNVTVHAGMGASEIAQTVVDTIRLEWNQVKLAQFDT